MDGDDSAIQITIVEDDGTWFRMSSGRFPQPVDLKVRIQPGRATVVGLRIDNDREVTSSELRLPLAELADSVYEWLVSLMADASGDLRRLEGEVRDHGLRLDWSRLDGLLAGVVAATPADELMLAIVDLVDTQAALQRLNEELADEESPARSRGRGAKPPTEDDYRHFARVYEAELRTKEWGAQARTAKRLNMDRSTALRWIRACEKRGLLESRAEKR